MKSKKKEKEYRSTCQLPQALLVERKGLCWYPSYHVCVTTMHGGFLEPLLTLIMPWYRSNQRHSSIRINIPAFFCSFIFSRAAVRWTVFCCVLLYAVTQSQMSALRLSQEFSCGLSKKKQKKNFVTWCGLHLVSSGGICKTSSIDNKQNEVFPGSRSNCPSTWKSQGRCHGERKIKNKNVHKDLPRIMNALPNMCQYWGKKSSVVIRIRMVVLEEDE